MSGEEPKKDTFLTHILVGSLMAVIAGVSGYLFSGNVDTALGTTGTFFAIGFFTSWLG